MSTIAEQVQSLEDDNAELLSQVAELKDQLLRLTTEHESTLAQLDQMIRFTAATRGMVETLAGNALEILRSTKRQAYNGEKVDATKPAAVEVYAPKLTASEALCVSNNLTGDGGRPIPEMASQGTDDLADTPIFLQNTQVADRHRQQVFA